MRPNILPLAKKAVYHGPAQQEARFAEVTSFRAAGNIEVTVWIAGAEIDIYRGADTATIANGLDPYRYLTWLLRTTNTADLTDAQAVQNLLPWNVPAECRVK